MKFKKANIKDINSMLNIIKQAQIYFKKQGIDQWQNNYPNFEVIRNDILNNYGYVLVEDNKIVGTAALSFDGEKTYQHIYNGKWLSNKKYAVVHRIAVHEDYKGIGLSKLILENIESICLDRDIHSIKIDTHKDNISMQKMLYKNGFKYCGIIYLDDKSERVAFEKIIFN